MRASVSTRAGGTGHHSANPARETPHITRNSLAISAIAAALALAPTGAAPAAEPQGEKCYGVAKAGANDCETATNSCAGTSVEDGQRDAWILVPKGLCEKLVGGSPEPKA